MIDPSYDGGGRSARLLLSLALVLVLTPPVIGAEENGPKRWTIDLGGGAYSSAAYDGSDEQFAAAAPYIRAEYERGNLSVRLSLTDGLTAMYFDMDKRYLATMDLGWGAERDPETYSVLGARHSHDAATAKRLALSPEVATVMRAEGKFGWISPVGVVGAALEYRPTVVGYDEEQTCFLPSLFYLLPLPVGESTELVILARLRFMDDAYAAAWYDSGAEAGIRDAEIAVQAEHGFRGRWRILTFAALTRYLGDAAASAYSASAFKYTAGAFALYRF